jgi:hypothetical protein
MLRPQRRLRPLLLLLLSLLTLSVCANRLGQSHDDDHHGHGHSHTKGAFGKGDQVYGCASNDLPKGKGPAAVSQAYGHSEGVAEARRRRRLGWFLDTKAQSVQGSAAASAAGAAGNTAADCSQKCCSLQDSPADASPIRVFMNFDLLEKDEYMCTAVGQQVNPQKGRGFGSGMYTCKEADVMDPANIANTKTKILKKRMSWAAKYMASIVGVRPVTDKLTYTSAGKESNTYGVTSNTTVEGYDLMIVATARPFGGSGGVAGYADCKQVDQFGRCTVGYFNFCPEILDEDTTMAPETIESERHTALHEIFHVLGVVDVKREWFCSTAYVEES